MDMKSDPLAGDRPASHHFQLKKESHQQDASGIVVEAAGSSPAFFQPLTASFNEHFVTQQSQHHQHDDGQQVTHAVITSDGHAVPISINPETGQFVTADGHTLLESNMKPDQMVVTKIVSQMSNSDTDAEEEEEADADGDADQSLASPDSILHDSSDLVSLASAAEARQSMVAQGLDESQMLISDDGADLTASSLPSVIATKSCHSGAQTFRIVNTSPSVLDRGGSGRLKIINSLNDLPSTKAQNIGVLNSDGTVSMLSSPIGSSSVRLVSAADLSMAQMTTSGKQATLVGSSGSLNPRQQLRIINPDCSVTLGSSGSQQSIRLELPAQLRLINSGSDILTEGGSKFRIVKAEAVSGPNSSPTKTTITLAQAQPMSVLSAGTTSAASATSPSTMATSTVKILPKSPIKNLQISADKTFVLTSPRKSTTHAGQPHQILVKKSPGMQQVVRIPVSQLQQLQMGNKLQYVRLISTDGSTDTSKLVPVKSGEIPILPSSVKSPVSQSSNVVKIALPQRIAPAKVQRTILPAASKLMPDENVHTLPYQETEDEASDAFLSHDHPELKKDIKPIIASSAPAPTVKPMGPGSASISSNSAIAYEPTGVRPRKPCNCTKSQCLKLYCDCFANGEFCNNCNCTNCFNNLLHERQRQKSIKQCLDRNPNAFRPKIGRAQTDGERRHNKGCNCKRSGCLKNYCECYEAKIPCTDSCKCIGCKNLDDMDQDKGVGGSDGSVVIGGGNSNAVGSASADHHHHLAQSLRQSAALASSAAANSNSSGGGSLLTPSSIFGGTVASSTYARKAHCLKAKLTPFSNSNAFSKSLSGSKQPFSIVTTEVVEATCQCLLAQAEEAERNQLSEVDIECIVIDEFGRCLRQIIDMARKDPTSQDA